MRHPHPTPPPPHAHSLPLLGHCKRLLGNFPPEDYDLKDWQINVVLLIFSLYLLVGASSEY